MDYPGGPSETQASFEEGGTGGLNTETKGNAMTEARGWTADFEDEEGATNEERSAGSWERHRNRSTSGASAGSVVLPAHFHFGPVTWLLDFRLLEL